MDKSQISNKVIALILYRISMRYLPDAKFLALIDYKTFNIKEVLRSYQALAYNDLSEDDLKLLETFGEK